MTQPIRKLDEGLSLVEVLVAVVVFAILATGIVASMTTISRMTTDNRARVTAANLASREIDRVRGIGDPFKVAAATTEADEDGVPYAVNGRTYTVKRLVSWISSAGSDVSCNSGTSLFYLRVNVRVTWPDMLTQTAPVQDDTILAPVTHISDSSSGAIAASVFGVDNAPQSGVTVIVSPNSGGKALTKQPEKTDKDGCTYAAQVTPGNYDLTISKSGWISSDQSTTASKTVGVTAGTTQSPSFPLFAEAAKVTATYVPGPLTFPSSFTMPTNLETTFTNTSGTWATDSPVTSVTRFPYPEGYGVVAGRMKASSGSAQCPAVDPQAWAAGTSNGVALASGTRATASATPGGTSTVQIPVGVVQVKAPSGNFLAATQATPASGTPACGISGTIYLWAAPTNGAFQTVALPYGSWRFYAGTTVNNAQVIPASSIVIKTNAASSAVASDGTVMLDPRRVK